MRRVEGKAVCRLGVVSYLNARPLIQGLEGDPSVDLVFDVPSKLPALLDAGAVDAALVPVIDLMGVQESGAVGRAWRIVSDACIGCDGETLTVRVFSRIRPEEITRLHVDGDSHTSVSLARIVWRELYDRRIEIVPFAGHETVGECEAVLLIGDKVVTQTLVDHEIETDLGAAWKSLTGLPFVFAVWAAPASVDAGPLAVKLSKARDAGVAAADMIAADFGPARGWPVALAKRYLSHRLRYTLGASQRQGMERFLSYAKQHDIVPDDSELVYA